MGDAAAAPARPAGPAAPAPGTETLSAVRLTAGLGSSLVIGSSILASSLTNAGKCSEAVGSMSVGLLGTMLMFGGMMPSTDGANTDVVWATGIAEFVLIIFTALAIIRFLALAKACPTLAPGSKDCGSGTRRGMAKVATGLSLTAIIYLLMALPDPTGTLPGLLRPMGAGLARARDALRARFGRAGDGAGAAEAMGGAAPTGTDPAADGDGDDADDGVGAGDGGLPPGSAAPDPAAAPPVAGAARRFPRMRAAAGRVGGAVAAGARATARAVAAFAAIISTEAQSVVLAIVLVILLGIAIGLPFAGMNEIASACKKRTAD